MADSCFPRWIPVSHSGLLFPTVDSWLVTGHSLPSKYFWEDDTGDKGPNTHWVHGENIEIAVNM